MDGKLHMTTVGLYWVREHRKAIEVWDVYSSEFFGRDNC